MFPAATEVPAWTENPSTLAGGEIVDALRATQPAMRSLGYTRCNIHDLRVGRWWREDKDRRAVVGRDDVDAVEPDRVVVHVDTEASENLSTIETAAARRVPARSVVTTRETNDSGP